MGTQGIVSVTSNGQVIYKFVAGCDGDKAAELAAAIREIPPYDYPEMYKAAKRIGFGCHLCFVLMERGDGSFGDVSIHCAVGGLKQHSSPLYWDKFDDPMFNPRWASGLATFTEVVEVGDRLISQPG